MRICGYCSKPLTKGYQTKYCSSSCAAKINNHKRFNYKIRTCPKCGKYKCVPALICRDCKKKEDFKRRSSRMLRDIERKGYQGSQRWTEVRSHARRVMELFKIEKKCSKCNWIYHLEVCHKKSISDFSLDILLSVVNDISNLMYLCPNHHWLHDFLPDEFNNNGVSSST